MALAYSLREQPGFGLSPDWPDGSVLYDRRSGHLHAVTPLARAVLDVLAGAAPALEAEAIVGHVQAGCDDASEELAQAVREALLQFHRLGFVDVAPT